MILTLNIGSSSLKYSLWNSKKELITKGNLQKIGSVYPNHEKALMRVIEGLRNQEHIKKNSDIKFIGHRVVQGGKYTKSVKVDKRVLKELKKYHKDFPLHQPYEIKGIEICMKLFKAKNIAVFDTSFFTTLPERAKIYGIPYTFYEKGIRKYGFHGTSHRYLSLEAKKIVKGDIITCHLGNGSSLAAIKNGKAIDTSMGFTPLEGLIMGTRCGDIDPGVIIRLMDDYSQEELIELLNKKSGLKGICGENDIKDILIRKDKKAKLAIEVYCYRVAKYIASYIGILDIKGIVFSAGIGENSVFIRKRIMDILNIKIDDKKNKKNQKVISKGKIKVMIIPTNEEKMIAMDCK